jgi:AraC-like DNA-binding protein
MRRKKGIVEVRPCGRTRSRRVAAGSKPDSDAVPRSRAEVAPGIQTTFPTMSPLQGEFIRLGRRALAARRSVGPVTLAFREPPPLIPACAIPLVTNPIYGVRINALNHSRRVTQSPTRLARGRSSAGGLLRRLRTAQANLARALRVDDLARRAAMSPQTFARQFAGQNGTTPHQWLMHQRVLAAQRRLEDGGAYRPSRGSSGSGIGGHAAGSFCARLGHFSAGVPAALFHGNGRAN